MITLPDFKKAFEYENSFYLSCQPQRIGKMLAHYELYKMSMGVKGAIVECGVFKGASLCRFAIFRELFGQADSKKILGFDAFGKFPETGFADDQKLRKRFIQTAGEEGIGAEQLMKVLAAKKTSKNIECLKGDILKTVPAYLRKYPNLKISLLNLDTDIYEPAVTILERFYPRLVKGGILALDDYGVFAGETKAVDDYFKGRKVKIRSFPFCNTPKYIIKDRD